MIRALLVVMVLALAFDAGAQPRTSPARPAAAAPRPRRTTPRPRPEPPPPPLRITVSEDPRPYHVHVSVSVGAADLRAVVADERLLRFEVERARGAPLRCDFAGTPARVDPEMLREAPAIESVVFDVIVDLRMYCSAAAFSALAGGARLVPHVGFRSGGRDRYVVTGPRRPVVDVPGASFRFVPPTTSAAGVPIRVNLPAVATRGNVILSPEVEALEAVTLYFRSDLFTFAVRSPSGVERRCAVPRHPITPVRDFFSRLVAGRRLSVRIDVARICPGLFEEPGVHDVIPVLELPYDGGSVGLTALTGTFRGAPSFVRVEPPPGELPSRFVRPIPTP